MTSSTPAEPIIVIPARGGSVTVPRKNLRRLMGRPLIAHTIQIALQKISPERVFVITDDDEIAEIAQHFGAQVIREKARADGSSTLDELIVRHLPELEAQGAKDQDVLLTMQPTCPLISPGRISEAVKAFAVGAGSVITVKDDRHLTWTKVDGEPVPLYENRVNRQLLPPQFRESGAIIGARIADIKRLKTRIVEPIALIELPEQEALDVDTFADLVVAEHWLSRKRILIHADAAKELGMGHVYRALALAQELARHEVLIATSSKLPLGKTFFDQQVFEHVEIEDDQGLIALAKSFRADLVVLDILDTELELVQALRSRSCKVVSFEDLGEGASAADLVVSDIYPSPSAKHELLGIEYAILAPGFEVIERKATIGPAVEHVLVLFGGTDPSELARKSLEALELAGYQGKVSCVRGLGASDVNAEYQLNLEVLRDVKNIASLMASADLALSSAGRTITELASVGVPTICLAQNSKEQSHTHAIKDHGVINLGLGQSVTAQALSETLTELIADHDMRQELSQSALSATAKRSNQRVARAILEELFS